MASPLSLELLPSHLQRAQLHTGVVLGWSRAEGGWGGSPGVSAADLWALQLGAGGRSTRLNGLQRSPQGPSGMRAQVRARLQRPAPSTGQGRFGDPVSPAESRQKPSVPGAGVCAAHPRDWELALRPLQCRKGQRQSLKEQSRGPAQPPFLSREPSFPQVLGLTPAAATF